MAESSKKKWGIWKILGVAILVQAALGVFLFILTVFVFTLPGNYTQTEDIADYGKFGGTHMDSTVQKNIESFFPAVIEDSFEIIKYSYRAEDEDGYGYEAYLEFRIDDPSAFESYVSKITAPENWSEFPFAEGYLEYAISNELQIWLSDKYQDMEAPPYQIEYADIKKILYSPQEQTVIYFALGVYDGGAATTEYLGVFFDRFHIDPSEYTDNIIH